MTQLPLPLVAVDCTMRDVLHAIDRSAMSLCLLTNEGGRLVGLMTDGDARRAILDGADLDSAALPFATMHPQIVKVGRSRAHVLDIMRSLRINAIPAVDAEGRVVGVHTLSDIAGGEQLPNTAIIMAGGRGTRLGHLTKDRPKPLMLVAGRPILEWLVLGLVGAGIKDIRISVNHLSSQIREHFGQGSEFGCRISYLQEREDKPLGTAGSLTLIEGLEGLADPLVVLNGDLMVEFDAASLVQTHQHSGALVTVGVRPYQHTVPFGVVTTDATQRVVDIAEKPTLTHTINAAIYAVSPQAIRLLPHGEPSTMPELVSRCLDAGSPVTAWHVGGDWIDVGTPADLARAQGEV